MIAARRYLILRELAGRSAVVYDTTSRRLALHYLHAWRANAARLASIARPYEPITYRLASTLGSVRTGFRRH